MKRDLESVQRFLQGLPKYPTHEECSFVERKEFPEEVQLYTLVSNVELVTRRGPKGLRPQKKF